MYDDAIMYIMMIAIVAIVGFVTYTLLNGKRRLIHWLYAAMSLGLVIWQAAIIAMKFVDPADTQALFLCDAFSNVGVAFTPTFALLMTLTFTKGLTRLSRWHWALFIPPVLAVLAIFTNPWHNLYYRVFSIRASEIVFGPFMWIAGGVIYIYLAFALFLILQYGIKSRHKMHQRQAQLFGASILIPLAVNVAATLQLLPLSIAATPLAFVVTALLQGIAIYYFDLLNIEPLALERVLDSISDGYVVLSNTGEVISFNKPFGDVFSPLYDFHAGVNLRDRARRRSDGGSSITYNLIAAQESAAATRGVISYEQTVLGDNKMSYYAVEVTPLVVSGEIGGYIAMFKDVTRLREAMIREQESLGRTMEQERLASLGQMIGGISHNLKTPIMSISGSVGALDKLVAEYRQSVGDGDVTPEDHHEIAAEMKNWLDKIQECCAYMSDIITTVKGLATNMNSATMGEFGVDELFKRVQLLMQHELKRSHTTLSFDNQLPPSVHIRGDINNLVQVVNNLVGNAVDAMQKQGGGDIHITAREENGQIIMSVADQGPGVPPEVRTKLFREMYTNKGAKGTGLGLYISAALMKGRFGGRIWLEDSDEGAVFSMSIPLEHPEEEA